MGSEMCIRDSFKSYILSGEGKKIIDLPSGPPNNHWTRNIILNSKEDKLLITVGSGTNVNAEGFDETDRAAIWEINLDGSQKRILASGLRNPVVLDFYKENQSLCTTLNERDGIGEFTPPDYLTEVKENGFYGWPYVYFKKYHQYFFIKKYDVLRSSFRHFSDTKMHLASKNYLSDKCLPNLIATCRKYVGCTSKQS